MAEDVYLIVWDLVARGIMLFFYLWIVVSFFMGLSVRLVDAVFGDPDPRRG